MSNLSKETIDKIQHDANSMADKKLEELKKAFNPDYEKLLRFIEGYHSGVVAGATEWAGKAQGLAEAIFLIYSNGMNRQTTSDAVNKALLKFYGSQTAVGSALTKYKEEGNEQ